MPSLVVKNMDPPEEDPTENILRFSVNEVAVILGWTADRVRKQIRTKKITAIKQQRADHRSNIYVSHADVQTTIERLFRTDVFSIEQHNQAKARLEMSMAKRHGVN